VHEIIIAAEMAAEQVISVRELEKMAKKANAQPQLKFKEPAAKKRSPYFDEVELALNEHLGRKVKVIGAKDRGVLEIEFYSTEDLSDLAKRLGGEE
jgi:ParB family chromosome partitioning protein